MDSNMESRVLRLLEEEEDDDIIVKESDDGQDEPVPMEHTVRCMQS